MSYRYVEEKKRPPPIAVPNPLPPPRRAPVAAPTDQQRQQDNRNASNSIQQGQRSVGTTPLVSPIESHPPATGSGRGRNAMATFTNLIDQARLSSPRKSEYGSWTGSNIGSTARSRHSERSQHDAAAAQARLEALDEETARGKMESRGEKNLFKSTGQIPPTPTDSGDEDAVYIRTEDLREQCRIASGVQQPDRDEPLKSPKKKLFQNLRNTFSKSSSAAPPPAMPNKAAQVFGTAPRQARTIPIRPIKPACPKETTPTRASRSDTVKSLPAKIVDPGSYAHRHRSGARRRNRSSGRSSSSKGGETKRSSEVEHTLLVPGANASFDSLNPPPPPAKDTPPPGQRPASPLRRAVPAHDLRESYSTITRNLGDLRLPEFGLSPFPSSDALPEDGGMSPTKFRPYTVKDYSKLIEGEAMHWPYPGRSDSPSKAEDKHPAFLEGTNRGSLQLPCPDGRSEERPTEALDDYSNNAYTYGPLQPRFYSPTHLSARGFAEGETPSKNSDTTRLLYSLPRRSLSLLHPRKESNDGSIKMVFQGDRQDIDPHSPTAHELNENENKNEQRYQTGDRYSDVGIASRVMQELRIGEKNENLPQKNSNSGQLQPDQSSSRLTDMLNTVSPSRSQSHGEFHAYCPSAVPSPLHKVSGPQVSARSIVPSGGSHGTFPPPFAPKTVDEHFFMTNEHLDVVGKTTWDLLETFNKQQNSASKARQQEVLALTNKHFEQLSSQLVVVKDNTGRIDACLDRVDGMTDNQHNMYTTLNTIKDSIKETIPDALKEQDKKMASMEAEMKEMKQMLQALQKSAEQKATEAKAIQQITPASQGNAANMAQPPFPSHNPRSQHSHPGYYGGNTDVVRDGHSVMPHSMTSPQDSHNDFRLGHQNGQQWAARPGYAGRNSKEERPSYTTNPYVHGMGAQYNGYGGGYSPYEYSPNPLSPPDAHLVFNNQGNPGQAK